MHTRCRIFSSRKAPRSLAAELRPYQLGNLSASQSHEYEKGKGKDGEGEAKMERKCKGIEGRERKCNRVGQGKGEERSYINHTVAAPAALAASPENDHVQVCTSSVRSSEHVHSELSARQNH